MCEVLDKLQQVDVLQEECGSKLVADPLGGSRLQNRRAVHRSQGRHLFGLGAILDDGTSA